MKTNWYWFVKGAKFDHQPSWGKMTLFYELLSKKEEVNKIK